MNQIFVWTLGDVIGCIALALTLLIFGSFALMNMYEQWKCKHDGGVNETQACDAICKKCGKNLGFIGNYRK
jgi:hypothetical protein